MILALLRLHATISVFWKENRTHTRRVNLTFRPIKRAVPASGIRKRAPAARYSSLDQRAVFVNYAYDFFF